MDILHCIPSCCHLSNTSTCSVATYISLDANSGTLVAEVLIEHSSNKCSTVSSDIYVATGQVQAYSETRKVGKAKVIRARMRPRLRTTTSPYSFSDQSFPSFDESSLGLARRYAYGSGLTQCKVKLVSSRHIPL
jgi:hypothetical protein